MTRNTFDWLDYLLFAIMLALSCGIGLYYACTGNKQQSKEEFLLGGRKLQWLPVALSLLVSYNSGIVQLGTPAEVYLYGIQYAVSVIGTSLAAGIAAITFVPLLYKLNLVSSYEYLELRFQSKGVKRTGTLLIIISQILYAGIATFSPAIALEAVTGFPVWASILTVGLVSTLYTTIGGIRAVMWADVFQCFIMFGGIIVLIVFGTHRVGGWSKVWEINSKNERLNFWNFDPDPTVRMTFWSLAIGRMFVWLPWYTVQQTSVQRFSSVPTLRKAQLVLLINLPTQIVADLLVCACGLVAFSFFAECDPLTTPVEEDRISSANQIVPLLVMRVISWPGFPGVFMASLFSDTLSTVSSCLNAVAAVTWEDFLKLKFEFLSEKNKANALKVLVFIYGAVTIGVAFLVTRLYGTVLQVAISFVSSSTGPIMGMFILGAFFRKANRLGVIVGALFGMAMPMWMALGSYLVLPAPATLPTSTSGCMWNDTLAFNSTTVAPMEETLPEPIEGLDKLYTVSFLWLTTIGTFTTVFVGVVVSLLSGSCIDTKKSEDLKEDYLILALDRCPCKKTKVENINN